MIQKWQRVEYGYVEARMFFQAQIGHILLLQGRLVEAESELKKSFDMAEGTIHRQFIISYSLLGVVKDRQEKPSEAEDFFKKAVDYPFCWDQNVYKNDAYFLYGRFLLHQNRLAEAQIQFENAQKISPKTWHYPLGMALLAAKNGQETAALDWLEKALNSFYFDKWAIDEEPLFKKIRKNQRFKAMMKKYFPNPAKN